MNLDPTAMLLSLIFGGVGIVYLAYGKRQQRLDMRLCGLGLLIYPLLTSQLMWLIAIGLLLCFLPPLMQRFG